MIRKNLKILLVFITVFCLNISFIRAYNYQDEKNKDSVEHMVEDIFDAKKLYDEFAGEAEEESPTVVGTGNNLYWWPIGSVETTEVGGVLLATGQPETTHISSGFGKRVDPFGSGAIVGHPALDISGGRGQGKVNIIAPKDGIVVYPTSLSGNDCPSSNTKSSCGGGYGNHIIIQHSDGNYTLYGHLYENSITVKAGDAVRQGQVIAQMGTSGNSTGSHLHFEVRVGTNTRAATVDPLTYVDPKNPRPTSTVVEGSSSKQTVCLTLKENGYYDNAVVAILRNMYSESNFIPNNLEGIYEKKYGYTDETYTAAVDSGTYTNFVNDKAGYGLVQWTYYTRKQKLLDYAKSTNKSIGDIHMQLEFFDKELKEDFPSIDNYLKNLSHTAEDSTVYFCEKYENPAGSCLKRLDDIESYKSYVKNGCNE